MSSKCPNCELPITAAPWRYDAYEHGVHWVCPTDERVDLELIYAPISLSEAISGFLTETYAPDTMGHRIGAAMNAAVDDSSSRHPSRGRPLPNIG
jgi:hypothetical protein